VLPLILLAIAGTGLAGLALKHAWHVSEQATYRVLPDPQITPIRIVDSRNLPGPAAHTGCRVFKEYDEAGFSFYGFPANENDACLLLRGDGLLFTKHQFDSRFGSMPILMVAPDVPTPASRLIVVLVGGPRDHIFPSMSDPLLLLVRSIARRTRAAVLVPGYYGTAHRSVYPQPDLDFAKEEIANWLESLENSQPVSRLEVVGGSSGSLLAFDLFLGKRRPTTLMSPPAVSIDELYRLRGVPFLYGTREQRAQRSGAVVFERRKERMVLVDLREDSMAAINEAFFGRHYRNRTWTKEVADLPASERKCLRVIFGQADDTVAQNVYFEAGLDRLVETIVLPGLHHAADSMDEADRVAAHILRPQPCDAAKPSARIGNR
jgi:hypothetical protein